MNTETFSIAVLPDKRVKIVKFTKFMKVKNSIFDDDTFARHFRSGKHDIYVDDDGLHKNLQHNVLGTVLSKALGNVPCLLVGPVMILNRRWIAKDECYDSCGLTHDEVLEILDLIQMCRQVDIEIKK